MENEKLTGEELVTENASENTLSQGELGEEICAEAEEESTACAVPEYEPKNKFEKCLYKVYRDESLSEMLRISSLAIVVLIVYACLSTFFVTLAENPFKAIELLLLTGVPFVAVSVARKIINAPRPYEVLEFYEKKPKAKSGSSFPSRHVFSVFVIAMALIVENVFLGAGLLLLGIALAAMRVLMGIHFIRDVVAGGIIGIVTGAIGLIFLYLI